MPPRSHRVAEPPAGLLYRPGFLAASEEASLADRLAALELTHPVKHGQAAKRATAHFGWLYELEGASLLPGPPIPDFLLGLRSRAAELAEQEPDALAEVLVTHYPPGAGIGWHRDAPLFGSPVVGVSLFSSCRMRFRRPRKGTFDLYEIELTPRSAYVLRGAARWQWQHGILECEEERWSLTFRTLRHRPERAGTDRPSPVPSPGA